MNSNNSNSFQENVTKINAKKKEKKKKNLRRTSGYLPSVIKRDFIFISHFVSLPKSLVGKRRRLNVR